ncbi:MAG: phosphatidylglycerophosphatase A [Calditrichaeota bacterium]|nr:phosphatidylglycerophosphatase A [Calditrichota bacterium]RQV92870.1 MAG: phosphatidylglycerophosphatase A [bacterium]RQW02621.1 MAG: phosphatidylglycerophosphatase A [Calditrichota bacterium]
MKLLHHIIATVFGAGYSPLAPGTAGSLLWLLLVYFFLPTVSPVYALLLIILLVLGVISSTAMEKWHGEDPSLVVIDELVGMGISLIFVPRSWPFFLGAFLLFRFFDIVKPWPINVSQKLRGGWGIMMDDILAGIFALIIIHLIRLFFV